MPLSDWKVEQEMIEASCDVIKMLNVKSNDEKWVRFADSQKSMDIEILHQKMNIADWLCLALSSRRLFCFKNMMFDCGLCSYFVSFKNKISHISGVHENMLNLTILNIKHQPRAKDQLWNCQKAQNVNSRGNRPNCHVNRPNCHANKPNCYVNRPNCHANKPNCHGNRPNWVCLPMDQSQEYYIFTMVIWVCAKCSLWHHILL